MQTHYKFDEPAIPRADTRRTPRATRSFLVHNSMTRIQSCSSPTTTATIVGYVYAAIEPLSWKELRDECGFIHDLLVADSARRSGVGAALLNAAIEWLRGRGMPRVVLGTAAQNETARRLFAQRGFRATMVEMTLEL